MAEDFAKLLTDMCNKDPDNAPIIPAISILHRMLGNVGSVIELDQSLTSTMQAMLKSPRATIGVASACELFKRHITFTSLEGNMKDLNKTMIARGDEFLDKLSQERKKIAKLAVAFIGDGHNILVHSRSRVVRDALIEAAKVATFTVYVTEAVAEDKSGPLMVKELTANNIKCELISDTSVGYYMERINTVLLGAEGVVESGGIINRIGTFQVAVLAKELNKPVYVLCESVKFIRFFPLHQRELEQLPNALSEKKKPLIDYTSPDYIRLLVTDLGILTPSAVSDQLIQLYM